MLFAHSTFQQKMKYVYLNVLHPYDISCLYYFTEVKEVPI